MKTRPVMLWTPELFRELLILHLALGSVLGGEPCQVQLRMQRNLRYNVSAGEFFDIKCPVTYCAHRPNVNWCKISGRDCLPLGTQLRTSWDKAQHNQVFILHFEPIQPRDNGSYSCSTNDESHAIKSHSVAIYVTEKTQNNSENPPENATSASGLPAMEDRALRTLLLYSLPPLGALLLLFACFCLVCFLKRHQGKEKKPSDLEGRDLNLVDIPVQSRTHSQRSPSETSIYDNDAWLSIQKGSESTTNSQLEGNKQSVVYASLNHCVIGRNPRPASNMQEAPTEYASVCVRS